MPAPAVPRYSLSSRARLTRYDVVRFPSDTLFDRIARAVCDAGCLPRKELFEAWEVARRVRRLFRGGRVVDFCGGHGLLAHVMLLLDDSSPGALVVDTAVPASAGRIHDAIVAQWPRVAKRVERAVGDLEGVALEPTDVVVSCHACGALTDRVIARAAGTRCRVGVLPCCHDLDTRVARDAPAWIDGALAIDLDRVATLKAQGYRVWTQSIPAAITPKHRLLIAAPADGADRRPAGEDE
jgi:hypothetical protein